MRSKYLPIGAALALGFVVVAVTNFLLAANAAGQHAAPHDAASSQVTKAICVVQPLGDNSVEGTVTFTKVAGGIEIAADLTGLPPGDHGFHVHEFGDCTMADGTCAGGHFNPEGLPHGPPDSKERHVGDFGNITADADGNATYKRVDKLITFSGPHSILGRSIIVHADPDDFSQPTGNAGGRIGCGVIGIAAPQMDH